MPFVPALVINAIRSGVMALRGPALARFASVASSRLGITVSGTASAMANQLSNYVSTNPMTAGLTVAALAASSVDFDSSTIIDIWERSEVELPQDVKYVMEQVGELKDNRQSITGDQDDSSVMGVEIDDLRKAARILAVGDAQINLLMDHFGDIDSVIAVRNALFAIDDEQLTLFKERHNA